LRLVIAEGLRFPPIAASYHEEVVTKGRREAEFQAILGAGEIFFGIEIPVGFERALRRSDKPAPMVAADATDPLSGLDSAGAVKSNLTTALE
jgi:hypothetical protein